MLETRTRALGCLVLAVGVVSVIMWLATPALVIPYLDSLPGQRLPAEQIAAIVVFSTYLPAVALVSALAPGHRVVVAAYGLAVTLAAYLLAWRLLQT